MIGDHMAEEWLTSEFTLQGQLFQRYIPVGQASAVRLPQLCQELAKRRLTGKVCPQDEHGREQPDNPLELRRHSAMKGASDRYPGLTRKPADRYRVHGSEHEKRSDAMAACHIANE